MGLQGSGGFMAAAGQTNQKQMEQQANNEQKSDSKDKKQAGEWFCPECGTKNSGKFCTECGTKKPEGAKCSSCGYEAPGAAPNFCPECGNKF